MKKTLLFAFVLCFAFVACNKDNADPDTNNNSGNNTTVDSTSSMKYIINGLTDLKMDVVDTAYLPLAIVRESGDQEKIALTLEGLPENVTATFSTPSGIPDFGTILTVEAKNAASGTYPIKLTGTTTSGDVKTYDLTLVINSLPPDPTSVCVDAYIGHYQGTSTCEQEPTKTYEIEIVDGEGNNALIVKNFPEPGVPMTILIDCEKNSVEVMTDFSGKYQFTPSMSSSLIDNNNIELGVQYRLSGSSNSPVYCKLMLTR